MGIPVPQVIEADLTWTGHVFQPDIQIEVDEGGTITNVGALGLEPTRRLARQALLPGFINAHSHAFQRGLRGAGERFAGVGGDFWSWRDAMYALVEKTSRDEFSRLCVTAFREMLDRGITTVGEFHYFHHTSGADDYAFDDLVLDAAREAGIRIVLLEAFYHTGGFGIDASGSQRRFVSQSLNAYREQLDRLASRLDGRSQHLGIVAHSFRAVSLDDIALLHAEAARRGMVLHVHVEEQQREIDECVAYHGKRPLALLNDLGDMNSVTAVHCTHATAEDLQRFVDDGGNVCVCPLTEANLGDGIPDLTSLDRGDKSLSLGTDSNARISMIDEMRWLEYGQRLATNSRGVLKDAEGTVATTLLGAATTGGARALGIRAGSIAPGFPADLVSIDLAAPCLAFSPLDLLLDALVFGGGYEAVLATCVQGQWRERNP